MVMFYVFVSLDDVTLFEDTFMASSVMSAEATALHEIYENNGYVNPYLKEVYEKLEIFITEA